MSQHGVIPVVNLRDLQGLFPRRIDRATLFFVASPSRKDILIDAHTMRQSTPPFPASGCSTCIALAPARPTGVCITKAGSARTSSQWQESPLRSQGFQ